MSRRSVTTDALDTLGTILDDKQRRDAIHLAVEPVEAGCDMNPGQHISVICGVAWLSTGADALGIVDPFLRRPVLKGERFWFVMYPRVVCSLRHVWSHPAFPDEAGVVPKVDAASASSRQQSEQWLRDFCDRNDCPDYDTVMKVIEHGSWQVGDPEFYGKSYIDDDEFCFIGRDVNGEIPSEFWDHVQIVLGREISKKPQRFSCSC